MPQRWETLKPWDIQNLDIFYEENNGCPKIFTKIFREFSSIILQIICFSKVETVHAPRLRDCNYAWFKNRLSCNQKLGYQVNEGI